MVRLIDSLFNFAVVGGVLVLALITTQVSARGVEPADAPADCGLYAYRAIVTSVYDGDTVTADVDLGFKTWRRDERLRLYGIDAPEVRGAERPAGLRSRDALRSRISGKEVIICTIKDKTGKYGRYLAEIFLDQENINDWLLAQGYAAPYGELALSGAASAAVAVGFERSPLPPLGLPVD